MSHADDDDVPIDRSLIDAARPGLEPAPGDKARVRRAVLGAIAGGAVASTAAGAQAAAGGTVAAAGTAAGAGVAMGVTMKLAISAIAIASVIGVVAVSRGGPARRETEAPPPSEIRPSSSSADALVIPAFEPDVAPSEDPALVVAPETTVPREAEPVARARAPIAVEAPSPDPVLDEARLLAGAQEAIEGHDGHGAMTLLAEHARRYPDGMLREERFATRIHALCELGETERARREATSFLDVFPVSVHAARVRASCGGSSTP